MSEQELREGLALVLKCYEFGGKKELHAPDSPWYDYEMGKADAALAYLRQHDGHAEFVRKVRATAFEIRVMHEAGSYHGIRAAKIVAMCDDELAKEQNNG